MSAMLREAGLLKELAKANERIRQLEAERVPEWKPIETAPKDGTHILIKSPTMPPTTVHWFDNGWHLSVNQRGEYSSYIWCGPNYWMPLDSMLAAAPQPKKEPCRCALCCYQHGHQIGCVNNPVDIALRAAAPAQEKDNRPANCRNRLSDEGKTYPRSGCAHCKTGGITGCPFKKEPDK